MRGRSQEADRQQQQQIVEDLKLLGGGGVEREPADDDDGEDRKHCHQQAERACRAHPLRLAQMLDQAIDRRRAIRPSRSLNPKERSVPPALHAGYSRVARMSIGEIRVRAPSPRYFNTPTSR